jgi:hypothetical protein
MNFSIFTVVALFAGLTASVSGSDTTQEENMLLTTENGNLLDSLQESITDDEKLLTFTPPQLTMESLREWADLFQFDLPTELPPNIELQLDAINEDINGIVAKMTRLAESVA